MTYENPEDYLDEEKEKDKRDKRWAIKKALALAEKKKTKNEPSPMSDNDVVEAARKFKNFVES